jgi:hypothetical protein
MLLSAYNDKQKADAAKDRAARGPNPNGLLKYYDANDNLVAYAKISPDEAVGLGAVKYGEWYKTGAKDENDKDIWEIRKVPLKSAPKKKGVGVLNKPDAPKDMPAAPAKAEQVSTQYERPVAVPGSPGSGQAAQASQPRQAIGEPGYKYKTETLGTDGKTKIGTDDMVNWYVVK